MNFYEKVLSFKLVINKEMTKELVEHRAGLGGWGRVLVKAVLSIAMRSSKHLGNAMLLQLQFKSNWTIWQRKSALLDERNIKS